MRFFYKAIVFVLLSAFLAVGLSAQPLLAGMAKPPAPAGCHHGDSMPAPQPQSYSCCQAGHNSAILQPVHTQELAVSCILPATTLAPMRAISVASSQRVLPTYEPPGGLPLRI